MRATRQERSLGHCDDRRRSSTGDEQLALLATGENPHTTAPDRPRGAGHLPPPRQARLDALWSCCLSLPRRLGSRLRSAAGSSTAR